MRWPAGLFILMAVLPMAQGADWIRVSTPNFDLYTTCSEASGRRTLEIFEQARAFFLKAQTPVGGHSARVTLVGFNGPAEYNPYKARELSLAYFMSGALGEYIVMSDLDLQRTRIAVHEYVHLLVRHSGLAIPLWLNEGLAEIYSTMEVRDGKVLLGALPQDRAYMLASGDWMRLPALLAANDRSPEYNEKTRANMFYAQSCLLAHMLMFGNGYADKFPRFLERASATGSSQTAFADVYGKSVADIDREMNTYFRGTTIGGAAYQAALPELKIAPAQAVPRAEIGIMLAKLVANIGRFDEAIERLSKLADGNPGSGDIESALGSVWLAKGDRLVALNLFRRALTHGASGWQESWNYARLLDLMGGDLEPRLEALRQAVARNPDLLDARLAIGRDLCGAGRYEEALAELRGVKNPDAEHAVAVLVTTAYAALGAKQPEEARRYAEQARALAKKGDETAAVNQLISRLERAPGASPEPLTDIFDDPGRPVLRRKAPEAPATKKQ